MEINKKPGGTFFWYLDSLQYTTSGHDHFLFTEWQWGLSNSTRFSRKIRLSILEIYTPWFRSRSKQHQRWWNGSENLPCKAIKEFFHHFSPQRTVVGRGDKTRFEWIAFSNTFGCMINRKDRFFGLETFFYHEMATLKFAIMTFQVRSCLIYVVNQGFFFRDIVKKFAKITGNHPSCLIYISIRREKI